jgi:hypothetical protein
VIDKLRAGLEEVETILINVASDVFCFSLVIKNWHWFIYAIVSLATRRCLYRIIRRPKQRQIFSLPISSQVSYWLQHTKSKPSTSKNTLRSTAAVRHVDDHFGAEHFLLADALL